MVTLDDFNRDILRPTADILHKRMYEQARELALQMQPDAELPFWDDLTDEQKEAMRKINLEHMKVMDNIAERFIHGASS